MPWQKASQQKEYEVLLGNPVDVDENEEIDPSHRNGSYERPKETEQ